MKNRRLLKGLEFTAYAFAACAIAYYFLRDRFSPPFQTKLAAFVYLDANRNGEYDLGDRPYAGALATLRRPGGKEISERTNLSGFSNFRFSLKGFRVPINRAGTYACEISPPAGLSVTSGNASQTRALTEMAGSPGGLAAERTFDPVGIAPILTVSIPVNGNEAIEFHSNGQILEPAQRNDEFVAFEVPTGDWKIVTRSSVGKGTAISGKTDRYPIILSKAARSGAEKDGSGATRTIGFDDLFTTVSLVEIPNGYENLRWRNWVATHQLLYEVPSHINAVTSGSCFAYPSSGHPATISADEPFDFLDAHFMLANPPEVARSAVVTLRAWRGEELAYEDTFQPSHHSPVRFIARYRAITRLEVTQPLNWQIMMDTMTVRGASKDEAENR